MLGTSSGRSRTPAVCAPRSSGSSQIRRVACSQQAAKGRAVVAAAVTVPPSGASFSGLGAFLGFAVAPFAQRALRRLFGRRRSRHRAMPPQGDGTRATFSVATYNLRGVMDRWHERKPLLRQCLQQIDADVLCFQECLTGEFGQDKRLLPAWYHIFPCKAALFNLARSGGLLRWYAHTVERLLSVAPVRRLMVRLPPAVEAWREQLNLRAGVFRTIRDLAMAPFFGNSVACRIAEAHEIKHSTLVLGDWRAAQRIEFFIGRNGQPAEAGQQAQGEEVVEAAGAPPLVLSTRGGSASSSTSSELGAEAAAATAGTRGARSVVSGLGGGFKVWVVNTHLDHEHPDNRQRQALSVCEWMDREKADCAAIILCGDFNGPPHEPFHALLRRLGYVSAYKARHGQEPQGTWPTGIQAPLMDVGDFETLDFVYLWAAPGYDVKVLSAEVFGLQPAAHDKTLYPSDHAAVKATIEVTPKVPVDLRSTQQAQGGSGGRARGAAPASSL